MARPGRKPKPTRAKKLTGNPGKRRINHNEPAPAIPDKIPTAPRYLDKVAKKEWRRMSKELHKLGLLTSADLTAFAAYCMSFSTWVQACENVQLHGTLVKAQSGFPVQSPHVSIMNKAGVEMRRWLTEFGMTPSSRSRIEIPEVEEKDELEEMIKNKQKQNLKLRAVK